jgi:hypothetical protein
MLPADGTSFATMIFQAYQRCTTLPPRHSGFRLRFPSDNLDYLSSEVH